MVSQVIDEGPESSIHVNRNPSAQTRFTLVRDGEVAGIYNIIYSLSLAATACIYIYIYMMCMYATAATFGASETPYGKSFCIIVVRRHCARRRRGYAEDDEK